MVAKEQQSGLSSPFICVNMYIMLSSKLINLLEIFFATDLVWFHTKLVEYKGHYVCCRLLATMAY